MAYFGELRGEVSPRIRIAKGKPDFDRRLGSYNNSFNINVSRLKPVIKDGSKETMLAYSERMQNIAKTRKLQPAAAAVDDVSLEVRAHQIYKKNKPAEKLPPERKILSFEQLVGRSKNKKERPQSLDEVTLRRRRIRGVHGISKARTPRGLTVLPSLPDIPAAAAAAVQKNVKVSFVNASDLYDFVDCSIRQTTFKKQPLGNLRREQDPLASDRERAGGAQFNAAHHANIDARVLPPITIYLKPREGKGNKDMNKTDDKEQRTSDNVSQEEETPAPTSQLEQLKIRPRRAKRMTLPKSGLDSIPETDRDREASHLSSFRWASSQQPLYIPTHSSPDLAIRGSGSPIRTANGSPTRTWSPTKSAMGSPKRTGSPMTMDSGSPTNMGSPRAEKYVKTERDIRVGLKVRPHSDPQTNVELDSDYEFEDDYVFYEDDSSSKVSEDSSNYVTRSLQKLVFLKDNSNNHPQQFT
ncbi:uncharacterized protein LOC121378876 [Gigantopelta aegis]|uniref:uncharacterized protein LOC121378876 n=1 Tax=Gigantopelta aegis TaxID=1735272 RepID=UPI001B88D398|nr:uncharacterized protein LOC121378876 [Gigantopelta aegis]